MSSAPDKLYRHSLLLTSDQQSAGLAHDLRLGFGDGDTLLLQGPIGAGKSHFARALIRGLLQDHNAVEDIPSPTFTLVQTYQAGSLQIWHSDLYRLSHVDEVVELGLIDAFDTALCLVEWPDRLGPETPKSALSLSFDLVDNPDHRRLILSYSDPKWLWLRDALARFTSHQANSHV